MRDLSKNNFNICFINNSSLFSLSSTSLIVWGSTMGTGINYPNTFTNNLRNSYQLSDFTFSVLIGLMLSDGWMGKFGGLNARFELQQSLDKFTFFWNIFTILSPYCGTLPILRKGRRNGVPFYGLHLYTRALPCLTNVYNLFYIKNKKSNPRRYISFYYSSLFG